MGSLRWSLPGSGRSGDTGHMDLRQQVRLGHRKQGQLHGGGEATGVSYMLSLNYFIFKCFRKSVNEVSGIRRKTEIVAEVDDGAFIAIRQSLDKGLCLSMTRAKEQHVTVIITLG